MISTFEHPPILPPPLNGEGCLFSKKEFDGGRDMIGSRFDNNMDAIVSSFSPVLCPLCTLFFLLSVFGLRNIYRLCCSSEPKELKLRLLEKVFFSTYSAYLRGLGM